MPPSPHVLGLFAKWPTPGAVKTRLTADPDRAAAVARAFLLDSLARYSAVADRRCLVFAPSDAEAHFRPLAGSAYELTPQADGDLGARLSTFVDRHQRRPDFPHLVLLGTDSPTLPVEHVRQAFAELDRAHVVLGPACDGGYYLIGFALKHLAPVYTEAILTGIPWSTSRVLQETVASVSGLGCSLALMPPWYDVDTPDDWELLRGHVAAMRCAGLDPGVPHTEALLREEPS
jgi:rSAM/selenodomain-associated transferase 1